MQSFQYACNKVTNLFQNVHNLIHKTTIKLTLYASSIYSNENKQDFTFINYPMPTSTPKSPITPHKNKLMKE